jgi:hypothetical protein
MNEPDFEQQLRAIRPAAPRRAVEERIAAELTIAPRAGTLLARRRAWLDRLLPALGWSGVGAAAAITTMLILNLNGGSTLPSAQEVAAKVAAAAQADVELEHELLDVAEAGIVDGSTDGLSRVVRYESVERHRWTDEDGAITVLEVPREDLVFVPVSFQ